MVKETDFSGSVRSVSVRSRRGLDSSADTGLQVVKRVFFLLLINLDKAGTKNAGTSRSAVTMGKTETHANSPI